MASQSENRGLVLIVDGKKDSRQFISGVLQNAGLTTEMVPSGEEALDSVRRRRPLLVILEVCLPGISGYEVCRELRSDGADSPPIVFVSATRTEPLDRVAGLLIGADDYIAMPCIPDELLARVRILIQRDMRTETGAASKLTPREQEVLWLLTEGLKQKEIAGRLFISENTVGTHTEHIFTKLGVRNRAQAVAHAYRDKLVTLA
jgi:DNA-binding NarL/FixJ family response regulator